MTGGDTVSNGRLTDAYNASQWRLYVDRLGLLLHALRLEHRPTGCWKTRRRALPESPDRMLWIRTGGGLANFSGVRPASRRRLAAIGSVLTASSVSL